MTFNYRTTRGTFKLGTVRQSVLNSEYVPVPNVWLSADNNIGYWVGGGPSPSSKSAVDKMNYSTNTTARVPGADISAPKNDNTCAGTSTEGFSFYGFNGSSYFRSIEKISYATDTQDTAGSSPNPTRSSACAIGSPTKAYVTGGYHPGGPIDGTSTYVYASSSHSTMPGVGSYFSLSGSGNTTHGYVGGGPNPNSFMFKFTYASDSEAQLPGSPLSTPGGRKKPLSAASSTGSYFTGGNPGPMTTTDKLTFATDACARVPAADAISGVAYMQGTGNSNSAYMLNWNAVTFQNLSYSTDTYSNLPSGANLSVNRGTSFGCVSGRGNNQPEANVSVTRWFDESGQSPNISWIPYGDPLGSDSYRLDLATETGADNPSSQMPTSRSKLAGTGNKTQGYFSSGYNSGSSPYVVSNTDKLTYSNDTCSRLPGSNIPGINGLQYHTAISSETDGYFWAGLKEYPTVYNWTKIYKITYSTDVMSTNPSDMTGSGNYRGASTNSATAGYETGGATLGQNAIKFTFSTGTAEAKSGFMNDAPSPRLYTSATGNQTAGYWAGGNGYTYIAKVTWSTETAEFTPGNLSGGGERKNATSNTEKGYWIGGYPQPSGRTDVTTFSTDTTARNPSMESLSPAFAGQNNMIMASVGGRQSGIPVSIMPTATPTATSGAWQYTLSPGVPNHGYYLGGGGNHDTGSTNSMKFSFATDTFDNSVRLSERFTNGTKGGKMASSPTHGYAVYGKNPNAPGGETGNSWVRKVQYSNDTGTSAPNAPNEPSYSGAVAGSTTNLYLAGGIDNHNVPLSTRTNVRKLTYSNDTWTTVSQANANYSNPSGWPRQNFASGGTQTYALWGWGTPNNYRTSISKYTYASDTGVMSIPGVTADYSQGYGQVGNSNSTHWWLARGGTSNGGPFQSQISRWTFATDTPQFPTTLTDQWYDYGSADGTGAINDGMTAGYWSGGHGDQSDSTSTLKISYATETASRGTDIPSGRHPSANGSYNGYSGTSVREWGAATTQVSNLI